MGRAARNNPVALAAKKGELPPKEKTPSKRERERELQEHIRYLLAREMIRPGSLRKELRKHRELSEVQNEGGEGDA